MLKWHLKSLLLSSLTAWYKNPRQLTQAQYDQLQTSLEKFGLIDKPIVNADADNTVIGGHQRLRALHDQGVREVECWVPERALSVREIEELNIRLNKNTGAWDFDVLANEFEIEDLLEWGFSEIELQIDALANDVAADGSSDSENESGAGPYYFALIVECETSATRAQLCGRLVAEGYVCRMGAGRELEEAEPGSKADAFDAVPVQW